MYYIAYAIYIDSWRVLGYKILNKKISTSFSFPTCHYLTILSPYLLLVLFPYLVILLSQESVSLRVKNSEGFAV